VLSGKERREGTVNQLSAFEKHLLEFLANFAQFLLGSHALLV
jgi:hypothetical protein